MKTDQPRVEYVVLGTLKPARRNPKKHDIQGIASSIRRFGFADVLIENAATGRLVAGHGRDEALRLLHAADPKAPPKYVQLRGKGWLIPVLRGVSFKSEAEAEKFLLGDNRLVEVGGWNAAELAPILRQIRERGGEEAIRSIGWAQVDYEKLLANVGTAAGERQIAAGAAGDGVIRQIVFPFTDKAMNSVLARLGRAMTATKTDNHSAVLVALLEDYEKAAR